MDWFVGQVEYYEDSDMHRAQVIVPSEDGFTGAVEQLKKWYGHDMESITLSYLAVDHPILELPEEIITDISIYAKEHYI